MAELTYYCGTMDSGKSTLALQTAHNHQSRGRTGLIFTNQDRCYDHSWWAYVALYRTALAKD